ncbi:MAG: hypothetical protein A3F18_04775 [Legionellales bacterium RIFCSPHIGHO2_12_FULL_37_14]|nr:MAG: hypothetical protein A3F18_04775 [Legionellales bacterium RIFCSPHIGHO2_12_FULL_37_14]
MGSRLRFIILLGTLLLTFLAQSAFAEEEEDPTPVGNFALPASQQPGPFYSFGSNIIDKGQWQITGTPNIFKSTGERFVEFDTSILYGLSERSSLLFTLPSTIKYSNAATDDSYNGLGDVGLQGEYTLVDHSTKVSAAQISVIAALSVPSGKDRVSYNGTTYFLAGTANYMSPSWLQYVSPGMVIFGGDLSTRPGMLYYLDIGMGRNLYSEPGQYISLFLLEVNGQLNSPNPYIDATIPTRASGSVLQDGYFIYLTPSLFISTRSLAFQIGASFPVSQSWTNAIDQSVDYTASFNVTWTVNKIP